MEKCELTGNQAASYGAGVALSALRSYLDRGQVGEVYFKDKWVVCVFVYRCMCMCVLCAFE